jgi:hypothetical protein
MTCALPAQANATAGRLTCPGVFPNISAMFEIFRSCFKGSLPVLVLAPALVILPRSAGANVYASNVKLNAGMSNVTNNAGDSVTISYILNEPASGGVSIYIVSGARVVRTINVAPGAPGSLIGANAVVWNGRDNASNNAPAGTYNVVVAPQSTGYPAWTQITSDNDPNTYVYDGRGIAVDGNRNSPFYGRIFVANSAVGIDPANTPGDNLGILKFNADGSAPDDGILSTVAHSWPGGELGPRKVEVSSSDQVYALDISHGGEVFSWDAAFSSNSFVSVLTTGNVPAGARLNGLAVTRLGTNMQIWASDNLDSAGVLRWFLGANGACSPGDPGKTIVGLGTSNNLSLPPQDVALDRFGNIYVCQSLTTGTEGLPAVLRFHAYDPSTNSGAPELVADWAVGAGTNTYGGATGIAVDPTGTYVAASFEGVIESGFPAHGNTKVLRANTGAVVAEIDLNLVIQGDPSHQDTDCAWDAVGNLYYIDNYWGRWRAVSPPGANSSSTAALAAIQILPGQGGTPPTITGISVSGGIVTVNFSGATADTASAFKLQSTASFPGTFTDTPGSSISMISPGQFRATAPVSGPMRFYRIQR